MIVSTSRSALVTAKAYEGLAHSVSFWMWTTIALLGYRCWTKRSKCSARFQHIKTGCISHCASLWTPSSLKQSFVVAEVQSRQAWEDFLCTKQLLQQYPLTPNTIYTGSLLHPTNSTPETFCAHLPCFFPTYHFSLFCSIWACSSSCFRTGSLGQVFHCYPNGFTLKLRSGSMIL